MNPGDIANLLFTTALGQAISSPALPMYQQGKVGDESSEKTYIVLEFVPNDTANLYVGHEAPAWYQGFLQMTVVMKAGEGIIKPFDYAGLIIDLWGKGTILEGTGFRLKVPRKPSARGPIKDGKNWRVPVVIPYSVVAR